MKATNQLRYVIEGWRLSNRSYFPVWFTEGAKTVDELNILVACVMEDTSIKVASYVDRANGERTYFKQS